MTTPTPVAGQSDLLLSPEDGSSRNSAEYEPDVAAGTNGGFVAIWDDFLTSAADADGGVTVMVRRFDGNGAALGQARAVTTDVTGNSSGSGIVALGNGKVAIGWDMALQSGTFASRIGAVIVDAATGANVGTDLTLATGGAFAEGVAFQQIVALSGGRAGVIFSDGAGTDRLRLAVVEADGTAGAVSTLFTVTATQSLPFIGPGAVSAALGGPNADTIAFVTQNSAGGGSYQLLFRKADGSASTLPTVTIGPNNGMPPTVFAAPGGGFAVARTTSASGAATTQFGVQRYDAAGALIGSEIAVSFASTNFASSAELLPLPDGGVIVAMAGVLPGFTDANIYAQRIAADGSLDGGVTRLDAAPAGGFQARPQLALTTDNDLVTVWEDPRTASTSAIYAARHDLGSFPGDAMTLDGTNAANTLDGDANGDRISGRGGDDLLRGFGGADVIGGGAGADTIEGGDGADLLRGGLGNDLLRGGADADRLFGEAGADTLEGGAGADRLYGGAEGDVFRFAALAESSLAASDRIHDWNPGDLIDLSAIGGIAFIGTAPFSGGVGVSQLQIRAMTATTVVLVDGPDADRLADMRIIIDGTHALTASDFIL